MYQIMHRGSKAGEIPRSYCRICSPNAGVSALPPFHTFRISSGRGWTGTCLSMASRRSAAASRKLPEVTGRVRTGRHVSSGPHMLQAAPASPERPPDACTACLGTGHAGAGGRTDGERRAGRGRGEGTEKVERGRGPPAPAHSGAEPHSRTRLEPGGQRKRREAGCRSALKQPRRPFPYRGFLRNQGNGARSCACAARHVAAARRAGAKAAGSAPHRPAAGPGRTNRPHVGGNAVKDPVRFV